MFDDWQGYFLGDAKFLLLGFYVTLDIGGDFRSIALDLQA